MYLLIDPTDSIVRYVGCSRNVPLRVSGHVSAAYKADKKITTSTPLSNWLMGLRDAGLMPEVRVVFKSRNRSMAFDAEHAYHHHHRVTIYNRMLATATVIDAGGHPTVNALLAFALDDLRFRAQQAGREMGRAKTAIEQRQAEGLLERLRTAHNDFLDAVNSVGMSEKLEVAEVFDRETRMRIKRESS